MLTSCAGSGIGGYRPVCPAMEQYDAATQDAAAIEVEGGSAPVLSKLVADYATLRSRLRAAGCR